LSLLKTMHPNCVNFVSEAIIKLEQFLLIPNVSKINEALHLLQNAVRNDPCSPMSATSTSETSTSGTNMSRTSSFSKLSELGDSSDSVMIQSFCIQRENEEIVDEQIWNVADVVNKHIN